DLDMRRELLRLFSSSAGDYLDGWFESDPIKAVYGFDGIVGNYASPYTPGSAARLGWYPRDLLRQRAILRPTLGAIDAGERRLGDRGAGGARSEYEAFAERVGGEPVGSVQTGAGALADG